jgi:hypothetical protein
MVHIIISTAGDGSQGTNEQGSKENQWFRWIPGYTVFMDL